MHISTSFVFGVAAFSAAVNAVLTRVNDFGSNPTNLQMNINVPAKLADKPAIILALHLCAGTGELYALLTKYNALSEEKGFITIFPSSKKDLNCWEVNTAKGLSRDAGGDNQGLVNMIKYTIQKYNADPTKVFVTGSSSGCMMTNVLMATYPDVFAASTCYSGVAAGCLAGSPGASPISSDPRCANGQIIKTQAEWVAQAKAMYPGYNGPYPRMLTWHGTADLLVKPPNLGEQLKQWSGMHGVEFSKNVTNTPQSGYTQIVYGDGSKLMGYIAEGVGHTVPVHEAEDLKWFGL
ncbi:carbohydrate esterase family 1 protein [Cucurbitaria berberidis CBS 394.84]|uniref:Carboxylic ester hydrolase n=1 Tax=Cucurbitaria berberidis CBS 394.84 TaxID=1168544 RepID=A0A9P4L711_9PLEO|nr:carbohydrate esterase family 1 protein [Cucurbitaria berberidis CBS 394.84]KAF1844400.1 carbohydrate esterase family 1 protein [Cucurbitaria berberidis CBS 394.84]